MSATNDAPALTDDEKAAAEMFQMSAEQFRGYQDRQPDVAALDPVQNAERERQGGAM